MNRKQRRAELKQQSGVAPSERAKAIFNDALSLHQTGRLKDAEARYRDALRLDPKQAASLHMLGVVLAATDRSILAIDFINAAIAIEPNDPIFYNNLGLCHSSRDDWKSAVASYKSATGLDPQFVQAFTNLGEALRQDGQPNEAIGAFQSAIGLEPTFVDAHHGLGLALLDTGDLTGAIACFRRVTALKDDHAAGHTNLGMALSSIGALDDAISSLQKALWLDSRLPEAHNNLGVVLRERGRFTDADEVFQKAIELRPDFADARANLATSRLATGDMAFGWAEYEWRLRTARFAHGNRHSSKPQWQGDAAEGRVLMIHAEQGYGDTIQFCRYATLAAERGFNVLLEVQAPLKRLLENISGVHAVIAPTDPAPEFDVQIPMLSLPYVFKTEVETVPPPPDLAHVDSQRARLWRSRLDQLPKSRLRVGLAWAGNPDLLGDERRSIPFNLLEPILKNENIQFFSLQKDRRSNESTPSVMDYMEETADFADTAALIENLDLVISVDTAIVHLAASMGKPVWLLNRFSSCHRWLREREDSPWYPTLRIYQQKSFGDWTPVLDTIGRELELQVGRPTRRPTRKL